MADGMFANLGPALARLRGHRGHSQAAVARAAGIGKSQLSKYESGKELPKMESLERCARLVSGDRHRDGPVWTASPPGEEVMR